MSQMIQLNPTLPVVTPHGTGWAHFVIEHGDEHHLQWVVVIDEGKHANEFWVLENVDVRMQHNQTMGRSNDKRQYKWGKQWDKQTTEEGIEQGKKYEPPTAALCHHCGCDYDEPYLLTPGSSYICPLCVGILFAKERKFKPEWINRITQKVYQGQ